MRAVLAVLVALALPACQLRLAVDVSVAADGSGELLLAVALDRELTELLRDAGLDPLEGLADLRALATDWTVETDEDGGGVSLRLGARFDDAAVFGHLADGLHAGLDPEDGALFRDLRLAVDPDGSIRFGGAVGLLLPAAPGAEGAGVQFDAEDLRRLLAERGDELVRYDVRLTLPAPPAAHDADEVSGRSLVWRAPVGTLRPISARSQAPGRPALLLALGAGLTAAAVTSLVVVLVRRRARRDVTVAA